VLLDVDDRIRVSARFANSADAVTDPTTVTVTVAAPNVDPVTYTHGGGVTVKDGTGLYHIDLTLNHAGLWWVTWEGTGALTASGNKNLQVNAGAG